MNIQNDNTTQCQTENNCDEATLIAPKIISPPAFCDAETTCPERRMCLLRRDTLHVYGDSGARAAFQSSFMQCISITGVFEGGRETRQLQFRCICQSVRDSCTEDAANRAKRKLFSNTFGTTVISRLFGSTRKNYLRQIEHI